MIDISTNVGIKKSPELKTGLFLFAQTLFDLLFKGESVPYAHVEAFIIFGYVFRREPKIWKTHTRARARPPISP